MATAGLALANRYAKVEVRFARLRRELAQSLLQGRVGNADASLGHREGLLGHGIVGAISRHRGGASSAAGPKGFNVLHLFT